MTEIVERTHGGAILVPLESKFLERRTLFIEGQIDSELADSFKRQMWYLLSVDNSKVINIILNSPGGEIQAGLLINDIIQDCVAPINIICTGIAYSMAAVILAGGQKGRRFILKNSEVMIHEPLLLGSGASGNCSSIKATSDRLLKKKKALDNILSNHTGRSLKEIAKKSKEDCYFSAEEAIAFGLCDKIISFNEIVEGENV